ncbi:EthD domain-containing protein [Noviherbaspirillum sedimenti]|uniref:EthD domain-containing protein n=1 Tax=Noviherbaspirillum sedimenti TaxID=2320865 RepID=A0A3A3G5T1_9BURK|nr:EthD domain-containing protein [Noviherbaspirillum sedimenti]RJG03174.1 hypothetical protein D3878_17565 [Noviherbaspirillum sedimenti]
MIKFIVMLKKRADLTTEQFRDYYESTHAVHAVDKLGHLWAEYRRNYPLQSFSMASGEPAAFEYDAITEIVFKDQAAFDEMMRITSEPETKRFFAEDEAKFLDRDACRHLICNVAHSMLSAA